MLVNPAKKLVAQMQSESRKAVRITNGGGAASVRSKRIASSTINGI